MSLKVTMIIPTLVQGGAEKQMSLLAAGLPKAEFEVEVVVLTQTGPWQAYLEEQGITVHVIGKRFKLDPLALLRLWRHLRRSRPDIVHTWIFAANAYGRLAAWLAGVPLRVAGERCVDPWKSEFHFWLDRWLAHRSAALATNSQGVVDFYQQRRIGLGKFHVIPNGIVQQDLPSAGGEATQASADGSHHSPMGDGIAARQEWLSRLQLPNESKLVVTLARLWPQKRIKDLIWAVDLVSCTRDDLHLVIAGEGPQRQRLQEFAHEARVADRVHFVGHLADPRSLLQAADLFALASEYEGQSNALMEAISRRVPAIVSDIPGNRDLIPDADFGYLFKVGDRAELAKRVVAALAHPEVAAVRAQAAWDRLQREFTLPVMIERHARLYQQLAGERGLT